SYLYVYIFIACFLYTAHQTMVFIGESYLGGVLSSRSLGLGIVESIIFSVVLLSFLKSVRRSSDMLFYKGRKPGDAIKDLAIKINKEIDFESLLRIIKKEFKNIIGTEDVKVIILDSLEKNKILKEYSSIGINYPVNGQIFKIRNLIVNKEKKEKTNVRRELDKYGFKVAVPLLLEDKLRGIIFLGEKYMGYRYNEEDLNFLRIVGSHAAIAIHNSLLCEQLGECNLELEKKLREKMEGIEKKNERLKRVLKSQSQFLDIASHQLRTPMSVIKGMLSMIQEKRLSQKKKDEFLVSVYQNALRLEDIIETILTASELDSGSFGFELEPVQLKPLLLAIEEKEKVRAKKKDIKLKLEIPKKYLLPVLSNKTYLKQIIDSLVDNAFQYTQEGEIAIKLIPYKDKIDIDVTDTGIGISSKEKENIFDKFCRGKNAIDTYGNGSGLGLYVAKKIIDEYHRDAKIFVKKSALGKGSTFSISLPIVKNG
ncbi:GAF domain-containing sensor histidine kinase, partial [bacterium]|nr:GAF domain-containing sensor histidine kinase [bacterium]